MTHWLGLPGIIPPHLATHSDVYVRGSAVKKPPPPGSRGTANDAAALPGLALDIDVNGGPQDRTGAAPDEAAAVELAHSIAPPTIIVTSGYGIQPWWVFDEPWVFKDAKQRAEAAALALAWHSAHADKAPFKIDSVFDLARVMRLPGTENNKGTSPAPVSTIASTGEAIPRATLAEHARGRRAAPRQTPRAASRSGIADQLSLLPSPDDAPLSIVLRMIEADDVFKRTWHHKRRDRNGVAWSMSQYDVPIIRSLLRASVELRLAVAAAMYARVEHGTGAHAEKLGRLDYWQRTAAAALQDDDVIREEAARENAAVIAELHDLNAETDPVVIHSQATTRFDKLNRLIGGGEGGAPRVVEWHQWGLERNEWWLSDSTHLLLGSMEQVLNYKRVKAKLAEVSNMLHPGRVKETTWEAAIHAVLPLRIHHVEDEHVYDQRALEWVSRAANASVGGRYTPDDINQAIIDRRPFLRDGKLYITTAHLAAYLRANHIQDLRETDMPPYLNAGGFEIGKLNYTKTDGKRSSRSYWSIGQEHLP